MISAHIKLGEALDLAPKLGVTVEGVAGGGRRASRIKFNWNGTAADVDANAEYAGGKVASLLRRAVRAAKAEADRRARHAPAQPRAIVVMKPLAPDLESSGPSSSIETFTPDQCKALIDVTGGNYRALREEHVLFLGAMMSRGEWRVTGSTIVIDNTGRVVDGQHRLMAAWVAGVSLTTAVLRGVERAAVESFIDVGQLQRSTAQMLQHKGARGAVALSSALRLYWLWAAGVRAPGRYMRPKGADRASPGIISEMYAKLSTFADEAVSATRRLIRLGPQSSQIFLHMWLRAAGVPEATVEEWFTSLATGVGLFEGHPALALRAWYANRLTRRTRTTAAEELTAVILAWNAFATARLLRSARGLSGRSGVEPIEEIVVEVGHA